MFKGGSIWRPPPMNPWTQGMPDELIEVEEKHEPRRGSLSNRYFKYYNNTFLLKIFSLQVYNLQSKGSFGRFTEKYNSRENQSGRDNGILYRACRSS